MELLVRFPPILFVLVTALCGSLLPIWLDFAPKVEKYLFRYGNAVAAGVLLAAGFVHMFPDANTALNGVFEYDYPFAGLIALCGALTLFVLDNIVQSDIMHGCLPYDLHSGYHTDGPSLRGRSETRTIVMYMLFGALSFHSVFEGLAMGANARYSETFYAILWAILAHKFFAALALGISLTRNAKRLTLEKKIVMAVLFSIMTPLGAVLGVYLSAAYAEGTASAKIFRGSLTAFSAGIFIYVSLVEIVAEEFPRHVDPVGAVGGSVSRQSSSRRLGRAAAPENVLSPWSPLQSVALPQEVNGGSASHSLVLDDPGDEDTDCPLIRGSGPISVRQVNPSTNREHIWSRLVVLITSASMMSALALYT